MEIRRSETILEMLRALADESRLALLRLVSQKEYTVGDLAELVGLGAPTVSHHLTRLRKAGLVTLRMAGNQRFYRVNSGGLDRFKQLAGEIERLPVAPESVETDEAWIPRLDWDVEDQKVLHEYTHDRKLIRLPSKQKRLLVILRWLATLFQPDVLYSETEVNNILRAVYEKDYVSLRRDLVDFGYLRRERGGGKYWLAPVELDILKPKEEDD